MLQKHEDFGEKPAPAMPQEPAKLGAATARNECESPRSVRRVVVSEESAAISLPNAPWNDDEEI